jgi:chromosome segregation ATPase
MNTYEINARNEVIPYTSGRKCTDTRAWRDATELELQQQDQIQSLERELTAVTEQCDGLRSCIDYASDQLHTVTEQRDEIHKDFMCLAELLDGHDATECRMNLVRLKEQRDRLAEALKNIASGNYSWRTCVDKLAPEALQSLTTNVNVLAPAGEKTPTKQENE